MILMSEFWFGSLDWICEDVSAVCMKYAERSSELGLVQLSPPGGEKKFYVYEWFTKDTGKVFYVGKGTGSRYRHIISDMNRPRGKEYKELQKAFGIDYRFLIKGLTSREAELYEKCMILARIDAGEVLLQSANNPKAMECWGYGGDIKEKCIHRKFVPQILVGDYYRRYFGIVPPGYDQVDLTRLHVTFKRSFSRFSPDTTKEMEYLKILITKANGKVFSTVAKGTQAIVEFDCMTYEQFMKYKGMGLLVYHAFDVVRCLDR